LVNLTVEPQHDGVQLVVNQSSDSQASKREGIQKMNQRIDGVKSPQIEDLLTSRCHQESQLDLQISVLQKEKSELLDSRTEPAGSESEQIRLDSAGKKGIAESVLGYRSPGRGRNAAAKVVVSDNVGRLLDELRQSGGKRAGGWKTPDKIVNIHLKDYPVIAFPHLGQVQDRGVRPLEGTVLFALLQLVEQGPVPETGRGAIRVAPLAQAKEVTF